MKLLFSIFLLGLLNFSFCQEKQKFINSINFYSGFNNISVPKGLDVYDLDINSNSLILDLKIKDAVVDKKKENEIWKNGFPPNFYLNASLEHKFANPKISWFFGLNFVKSKKYFYNFSETHTKSFETNGVTFDSKDSVQKLVKNIWMDAGIISIENAFSFSTDENKRFSAYGGASVQTGFSMTNYKYEFKNDLLVQEISYDANYNYGNDSYSDEINTLSSIENRYDNTVYSLNGYFSINAYFGTNIRLNHNERENKIFYLFSEFKPGYAITYVSKAKSLSTYYNGFFSWIGFRYKF